MNNVVKKERINKILNSDEYINWLEQFTLEHTKFYNDSFFSSNQQNQNIQDISLLYEIIENYAKDNYIATIPTVCGNYYEICHNNIDYQIGIMFGPETIYYCTRTNKTQNHISFRNIQTNAKTHTATLINTKMEDLTQLLNDMIDNNINSDIILSATEKTIQKVLKKTKRT